MSSTSNIDAALRGYCDRIVRLHEERESLNTDIREVYAEAKEGGFDITTLREIVRELRMEPDARNSRYELLDQYRHALGMLAGTPLGQAALATASAQATPQAPTGRRRGRRATGDGDGDATGSGNGRRRRRTSSVDAAIEEAREAIPPRGPDEAMARAREHLGGNGADAEPGAAE